MKSNYDPKAILESYQRLGKHILVAQELDIPRCIVSYYLQKQGIRIPKGGHSAIHQLPMEEVIARYQAGESTIQLAREFQVDPEVVRRRLKRRGVQMRPPGGWNLKGDKNHQWKGGRTPTVHYHRRQAYEVAAICLGSPLPQGVVIHHMDENPRNNDPSNLWLFRNQGDHANFHQRLLRRQCKGEQVDASLLARENGALPLLQPRDRSLFAHGTGLLSLLCRASLGEPHHTAWKQLWETAYRLPIHTQDAPK